jgi:hypothetical protein
MPQNQNSSMSGSSATRKVLTAMLAVAIVLWAEAGLALVPSDQVMQCSMTMHEMQAMGDLTCCPGDEAQAPATATERPPCCSSSDAPERPLAFVVSSERVKATSLDVVAVLPMNLSAPVAQHSTGWHSADAPRFIKPVLELKTDLRI